MIIAGTGHRPSYFPIENEYNESDKWVVKLKENLLQSLEEDKPDLIISGMAIGWDTFIAETALELRIPLNCYIPFNGQESKWPKHVQIRYGKILEKANEIIYLSETYSKIAFFKRDKAMVDACDKLYALLDPSVKTGGTFITVYEAEMQGKPIKHFWPKEINETS
jgi:uncharacterized phage-like protein YoqJ